MPAAPDIIRLLPLIIRLFPALQESSILGKVIPLFKIEPESEAEQVRKLSRAFKRKERDDGTKDSSQVIKLDDAISCVEAAGNQNGTVIWQMFKSILSTLIKGQGEPTADLLNPIISCLRENALRQDTPRATKTVSYKARPAKGHGEGRGGF